MPFPSPQSATVDALSAFNRVSTGNGEIASPRAIRGSMVNLQQGLALAFQFNPESIEFEKSNNWDIDYITGYNSPIFTWVGGKEKFIRFSLFFDATAGSAAIGPLEQRFVPGAAIAPPGGLKTVLGQIAVMDSFQAPSTPSALLLGIEGIQYPPPDCYFILGTRFWRTVVMRAPRKEELFDLTLRPIRARYEVELAVKESGIIQTIEQIERKQLALIESSAGFLETNLSVF